MKEVPCLFLVFMAQLFEIVTKPTARKNGDGTEKSTDVVKASRGEKCPYSLR